MSTRFCSFLNQTYGPLSPATTPTVKSLQCNETARKANWKLPKIAFLRLKTTWPILWPWNALPSMGKQSSTEVAFTLLIQQPRVRFPVFPKVFQSCWDLLMALLRVRTEAWNCQTNSSSTSEWHASTTKKYWGKLWEGGKLGSSPAFSLRKRVL